MRPLRLALVADGGSDRALIPIVQWHVRRSRPDLPLADIAFATHDRSSLSAGMAKLVDRERPDILLVHRDAEKGLPDDRRLEIPGAGCPVVRIVPVRMTEAWLLFNEPAIRRAARNPNGRVALELPPLSQLERLPDPKERLHRLIMAASELEGPRRRSDSDGISITQCT